MTSLPQLPEPSPVAARLRQLCRDGLGPFLATAGGYKEYLFPPAAVPAPAPIHSAFGCPPRFVERHLSLSGSLPPAGLYRFQGCHVGHSGTVLDPRRRLLLDEDLISAYWAGFLGRFLQRAVAGRPEVAHFTTVQFIAGREVPVRHLPADGTTTVLLAKPGITVYGHWILDVLPLAWTFLEAVRLGALRPPFRFLIGAETPRWARAMLADLFDIQDSQLVTFEQSEVLLVDELVVPSLARVSPLLSPRMEDFARFVFDRLRITPADAEGLPRRFCIDRSNARPAESGNRRVLQNQPEVFGAFEAAGLTPLAPETLPWRRQLALFARAEIVAGEYGSGMHSTLFSPASTVGLVLVNSQSNWTQSAIAGLRGQRLVYVAPSHEEPLGRAQQIGYRYDPGTIRAACAAAEEALQLLPAARA
jgi:capsular polysaccharide biosynthesis protein